MKQVLIIRVGEISLKGLNRPYFERKLNEQILNAVSGQPGCRLTKNDGRLLLSGYRDEEEAIGRICRVFGVHSVSPAVEVEKDMGAIRARAADMMRNVSGSFKVLARRSDKRFPLKSPEIAADVGEYLLEYCPGLSVDLHHPEHEVGIEIRDSALIYARTIPAVGGMPVGTNGRATLLLSGGIDSPVAGYMVAKRGVEIDAVYFHSPPFTSERAKEKVVALARILAGYTGRVRLFVAPFTRIQQLLHEDGPDALLTVLMRRFMMRVAQKVADAQQSGALVTGESVGQVASQTMESLAATDEIARIPVFRPLIGMDKLEIIQYAKKIGTFETSILPYEDCCTLFVPRRPATHPRIDSVRKAEEGFLTDEMVEDCFARIELIDVRAGQ